MTDLRDEWPSEMRRPEPEPPVERPNPTNDPAAGIARHQPCACDHHQTGGPYERRFCAWCGERWPCLVRRLADENAAIIAAGTSMAEAINAVMPVFILLDGGEARCEHEQRPEVYVAQQALDAWRALGLAAGDGDAGEDR